MAEEKHTQELTKALIERAQSKGSLTGREIVESSNPTQAARVGRLLVALGVLSEIPLAGDSIRGDRVFTFLEGKPLYEGIDLKELSANLRRETSDVEFRKARIRKLKEILSNKQASQREEQNQEHKSKRRKLTRALLQEVTEGQPETLTTHPIYSRLHQLVLQREGGQEQTGNEGDVQSLADEEDQTTTKAGE